MAECRVLDGVVVGKAIRDDLAGRVVRVQQALGRPPALGIVLVGADPASEVYVRNKVRTGGESGLTVDLIRLPATASLEDVLGEVRRLNASPAHDGILVQSPLPAALGPHAEMTVFETIDPDKDVDGFSPVNVGRLVQNRATLRSCTPAGVMEMLRRSDIPVAGRHAVVIGRSDIVGKPMALMLLHANATVTICHSRTADLPRVAATADILVVAIGRAGFVTPAFVKPGATVDRRRHEHDRRRGDGRGLVRARLTAPRRVREEGLAPGRRRGSAGRVGRRRADAGPARRRAAHHRDADEQHGRRGRRAGVAAAS